MQDYKVANPPVQNVAGQGLFLGHDVKQAYTIYNRSDCIRSFSK